MRFDVITLFPEMLAAITAYGVTRRAFDERRWQLQAWNPRDFTSDNHRTVDDRPFGGGPGMVMLAEPLARSVQAAREAQQAAGLAATRVLALAPTGVPLNDARVRAWAAESAHTGLVLVCGRYEGIDQRFLEACVDEEVSIGDFVMSGGEIGAMALIDAVVRHLPGALKDASADDESFARGLLDGPQYTRPEVWRGRVVPPVLMSGHHAQIARWRRDEQLRRSAQRRPELITALRSAGGLDARDEQVLKESRQVAQTPAPRASGGDSEVPSSAAATIPRARRTMANGE